METQGFDLIEDALGMVKGARQWVDAAASCGDACPVSADGMAVLGDSLGNAQKALEDALALMDDGRDAEV